MLLSIKEIAFPHKGNLLLSPALKLTQSAGYRFIDGATVVAMMTPLSEDASTMKTINQLLGEKDATIWSVAPDDTVYQAVGMMADKNIGAILVMEGDNLCGLLSERDYTRKIILKERTSRDTPVKDIMTEKVYCTHPEDTVQNCMAVMTEKRFRHLPVVEKNSNKVVGMVSIGDLVRSIIEEQQFTIKQLEQYINS